ncbi:4Fe-4S dicluster domain-containing protein [bacterium]|nr:4Fe-4S dicluster domain-containing protein [bacterium]
MMSVDRRKFLKLAGVVSLGAAAKPVSTLLASEDPIHVKKMEEGAAATAPTVSPGPPQGEASSFREPLTAKRWAMVIDTRKLDEATIERCIDACHTRHNVPEFEIKKDEIKWIWEEDFHHAFHEQDIPVYTEHIRHKSTLLLCNHCDEPPCTNVCPTEATFKREEDGLVMMDWHRCIGCRYCVVACPYGSRSFNWRDPRPHIEEIQGDFPTRMRGVVEKCTFCEERLARGIAPACVEASGGAIAFGDLEDPHSSVRHLLEEHFTIRRKPNLGTQPQVYYIV